MIVLWIILALVAMYLLRVIAGPSMWDRLLGMNLIMTKIIVVIIVFAYLNGSSLLLDFAIAHALMGFISTIFIALFLSKRSESSPRRKSDKYGNQ